MMQDDIGKVAGEIWHYLEEHGEATVSKLIRDIDGSERLVLMGIGWLAREENLIFEKRNRGVYLTLKTGTADNSR